jgi:hypothetical protein
MRARLAAVTIAVLVLLGSTSLPSYGQDAVDQVFAFETDKWLSLGDTPAGAPAVLHRIQVTRQSGGFGKSTLLRPGNSDFLAPIEFRIEYSNAASHDWKAKLRVTLLDEAGHEIDGYSGTENLDEGERHQLLNIKIATLKYGLEKAKKLRVSAELRPE